MRVGQHIVVTRLSTQKVVSLNSGESEYYTVVRCASEIIGLANTIRVLGHEAHVRVWTDAAAARGLAHWSGSGNQVLLAAAEGREQGAQDREDQKHGKNPADLVTKHLDGKRPTLLCGLLIVKQQRTTKLSSQADTGHRIHITSLGGDDTRATNRSPTRHRDPLKWNRLLYDRWIHVYDGCDQLYSCGTGVAGGNRGGLQLGTSRGTQSLDEDIERGHKKRPSDCDDHETRRGRALQTGLSILVESALDQISELVLLIAIQPTSRTSALWRRRIGILEQVLNPGVFIVHSNLAPRLFTILTDRLAFTLNSSSRHTISTRQAP